jgi:hypothetical protein
MYFDVDHTLVRPVEVGEEIFSPDIVQIGLHFFKINTQVVEDLKLGYTRGHEIIVWSQGGSTWAARVIVALELDFYVSVCMAKPSWYVDDRAPDDILDKSRYYYAGEF